MLSPEMISDPPLYFRAVPYAMSGITAVAGRARHLPTPPEEEEERGQGGTVPAVPCALRGGQPSVAAPPSASPVSHHGLGVRVQPREGAAPLGGCSEPRIAQAGSP